MRVATIIALAMTVALATLAVHCEGKGGRGRAPPDEEELRGRALYRDYGPARRAARADDAFDDYGHLRFGRADE